MANKANDVRKAEWWEAEGGFFGTAYREGDDSLMGYLPSRPLNLTDRTMREALGIATLLRLPGAARVVDAPCGYGRHSLALARMGFDVVGVDLNGEFLQTARASASTNLPVAFLEGDMRELLCVDDASMDAAINMFFSFGFFKRESHNLRVLESFHRVLKPNGKLLIHTDVSTEILRGGAYRFSERRKLSDSILTIDETFDEKHKRLHGIWEIKGPRRVTKLAPYDVRIYSVKEYQTMLELAGFELIGTFGTFEGDAFTESSEELIIIGQT
jgi:ubiquinone/menaquinone biosynthesis C-methylase UbiE